ncbi:MAG: HIT family protein [Candidatus Micrarchaeota archaeon]|nr:HIT family protein [Candidatus Micrarchaeota archaeon]
MVSCALCKEISAQTYVITSNKHASCLINLRPVKDGHVMVIPNRHVERGDELTADEAKCVLDLVEQVSEALNREFGNYAFVTINPSHRRSERHFHIHLIPSFKGTRDLFSIAERTPFNEEAPAEKRKEICWRVTRHLK